MKTVKVIAQSEEGIEIIIDDTHTEFMDEQCESTDAWAAYTVLKKLAEKGFIELECDAEVEERYKKQPNPFCGPPGPAGMMGVCECKNRVSILEEKVKSIESKIQTP